MSSFDIDNLNKSRIFLVELNKYQLKAIKFIYILLDKAFPSD